MTPEALAEGIRPWLRSEHAPAYDAALAWLWPRCRTEEERLLAPALLLLLAPLNALVAPCRPVSGSRVNFQITLSRQGATGPERVRLNLRTGVRPGCAPEPESVPGASASEDSGLDSSPPSLAPRDLWLDPARLAMDPLGTAAQALVELVRLGRPRPVILA